MLSHEMYLAINKGKTCRCFKKCYCSPKPCACSECIDNNLKRNFSSMYEDLSVPDLCQENTSNDNKCLTKQNNPFDEWKARSFLPPKKLCFEDARHKSILGAEGNSDDSSNEETEDDVVSWSAKALKMIERQGIPDHVIPINENIDILKALRTRRLSAFTQSIERKDNIHIDKEFKKFNFAGRRRAHQRKISSSKLGAKSLLGKRKLVDCAEEEGPGSDLSISSLAKDDLLSEKNSYRETSKSNYRIPISDIKEENVPHWKRYLENMRIPDSPEKNPFHRSESLYMMDETKMEFAETTPAVKQWHNKFNNRKINHASRAVDKGDSSGDETGYESGLQTPENELSFFQETVNHQASMRSEPISPLEINSSKSFQMIENTKTAAPLSIEECFLDLANTDVFSKLDSSDENSSFYSADWRFGNKQNPVPGYFPRSSGPTSMLNALQERVKNLRAKISSGNPFIPYASGSQSANGFSSNSAVVSSKYNIKRTINSASISKFQESSCSFCKVPNYNKPGCSKDAVYMGACTIDDTESVRRIKKRSLIDANFGSNMNSSDDSHRHHKRF